MSRARSHSCLSFVCSWLGGLRWGDGSNAGMEAQDADRAATDTKDPTNVGHVTQGMGRQIVGQMAERANYQVRAY